MIPQKFVGFDLFYLNPIEDWDSLPMRSDQTCLATFTNLLYAYLAICEPGRISHNCAGIIT